ncbi:MAG TPA: heat-inducible transcriptional repressor HrcA [Gaiellaceae bacterium]|jgi:heat-inducible transcriptional repressor|nr:heat-inducible transcriptional repressor HrcA [Gaiellaceae bacterium]
MIELTPRKREILRRVVEEYVATGQPVGSKALVERSGMRVSSSTVRSELSELEALGLLTHPHTSAGRVPTDSGYRLYAQELVDTIEGRPGPPPVDVSAMRNELEAALQQTTDALSQATQLLALVSAPSLEATTVRHVEVVQLQPRVTIVVLITSAGDVSKRVIELEEPADPGLVEWARAYLNETVAGLRLGARQLRRVFEDPSLTVREQGFLAALRPAFVDVIAEAGTQVYMGGAAGLLGDMRGSELEACQRLLELLERRAAVLGLLTEALDPHRTVVRVGPEVQGAQIRDVSYVGTAYGLPNRSLGSVGLMGPLRMDYEKAIRSVRAAAFELSRLVEGVYDED